MQEQRSNPVARVGEGSQRTLPGRALFFLQRADELQARHDDRKPDGETSRSPEGDNAVVEGAGEVKLASPIVINRVWITFY